MSFFQKWFAERTVPFSWRRIWIAVIVVFLVFGIGFSGLFAHAHAYRDQVLPGVRIADISVGGMREAELKTFLQDMNDKLMGEGLRFSYEQGGIEKSFVLYPVIVTEGSTIELLRLDEDAEVARLLAYGKEGSVVERAIRAMYTRVRPQTFALSTVQADKERITKEIQSVVHAYETEVQNADVSVTRLDPLEYAITSSSPGVIYNYEDTVGRLIAAWSQLSAPDVRLTTRVTEPIVREPDVEALLARLPHVFDDGALSITYTDPHTRQDLSWRLSPDRLREWITVQKRDGEGFVFGLNRDALFAYVTSTISEHVNVEAKNAKFEINEAGKVVEFQGSRPGLTVDAEKMVDIVNEAFIQRTLHDEGIATQVPLEVMQVEPDISTGEVNDLGITEVLGAGISDFSGSPANRIKNIQNGARKLNGVLIKPGDDFSAITYTQPYTLEGGYLPELVIKGDEIKPEIGGGLCQIGTTLFRMAMNSGMPITQRRNHSLVVSYYNDPANGLPGTDATIYEPAPDFRFKNDTGNYILIQTSVNVDTGKLMFTLWGTSDGRKGHYTKPSVSRWIPYGETRIIETTKPAPGEKECQKAYRGADASFTYVRELPDGTKEERVFESHYRPLPQICLVGVEEKTQCQETESGAGCNPDEGGEAPEGTSAGSEEDADTLIIPE